MPAIGARTTGDSTTWRPMCRGGSTGAAPRGRRRRGCGGGRSRHDAIHCLPTTGCPARPTVGACQLDRAIAPREPPACAPPGSATRRVAPRPRAARGSSPTRSCGHRLGMLSRRRDVPVHRHVDDVDAVLAQPPPPRPRRPAVAAAARPRPGVTHPDNVPWVRRQKPRRPRGVRRPTGPPSPRASRCSSCGPTTTRDRCRTARTARRGCCVRGGGVVVWFAGDTSLHADMAAAPRARRAPPSTSRCCPSGAGALACPPATWARRGRRGGRALRRPPRAAHPLRHAPPLRLAERSRLGWTTEPGRAVRRGARPTDTDAVAHVPPVGGAVSVAPRGLRRVPTAARAAPTARPRCRAGGSAGTRAARARTVTTRTHGADRAARAKRRASTRSWSSWPLSEEHGQVTSASISGRHSPMTPAHAAGMPSKP